MNIKVSIIMSVYNGQTYLREAIDSILWQSFRDFEFIIIDDGSSDDTLDIINGYDDYRIKLIKNEQNTGLAASLNQAISVSHGKYTARMDADDISSKDRIMRQYIFMESHENVDICGTGIEIFGSVMKKKYYPRYHEAIKFASMFGNPFAHPTVMIRKESLLRGRYKYEDLYRRGQDYELWSRMLISCRGYNIRCLGLRYRFYETKESLYSEEFGCEYVNYIRDSILRRLGVDFNNQELEFYKKFSLNNPIVNTTQLKQLFEWTIKLIKNNHKSKFVTEVIFLYLIIKKALKIIIKSFIYLIKSNESTARQ